MARKPLAANYRIEALEAHHDRASFCCSVSELDIYLQQRAGQDLKRKLAAVFVLTPDGETISGFYTLSAHSIASADLPLDLTKRLPRFPLPVTLLGRMAVAQALQGSGLGEYLLLDALNRALNGSRQVASWAVVVDAKAGARSFYLKHDFVPLPTSPDRLFLPMKTIETLFAV
ncbi:MAG: GNAT family N-acetyltransferase [Terracidiphilus sp.]